MERKTQLSKAKAKKKPQPYLYTGDPKPDIEEETDDIYNSKEREEMLDDDEITAAEEGFMRGRDDEPSQKQTRKNAVSHTDETAVELAKEDAEDD
jgi:hypothetical protein